jgi:hypothetical protein
MNIFLVNVIEQGLFLDSSYINKSLGSSGLYVFSGGRFSKSTPASQLKSSRQSFSTFLVKVLTLMPMGQARSQAPQSVHLPA